MSKAHCLNFVLFVFKPLGIRDYKIYARHIFLGKSYPRINENNIVVILNCGHVSSDFTQSAQVDNLKTSRFFTGFFIEIFLSSSEYFYSTDNGLDPLLTASARRAASSR